MFPKYRYMDDWRLEAVARIQMFHSKSQAEFYVKNSNNTDTLQSNPYLIILW
jgi:hypothetical protein